MNDPFERDHKPLVGKPLDLAPALQVVTVPNASPMTFTGTQTYLLGTDAVAVIDPGPDNDAHLNALIAALKGRPVSHIIVTHSHIDHSPLSRRLAAATKAPILAFGTTHEARSPVMERLAQTGDLGGREGTDEDFRFDVEVTHGQIIQGDGWQLEAIHTPGHLSNHLCFAWNETGAVFTGDHVMGWATTMVSPPDGDLTQYMASMQRLAGREDDQIYYPGHGGPVNDPMGMVRHQINHRNMRESQIIDTLKQGTASASDLAALIYTDVDPYLLPAATRNVFAHLIDLNERELVLSEDGIWQGSRFQIK